MASRPESSSSSGAKKLNWLLGFLLLVATGLAIAFGVMWGKAKGKETTTVIYRNTHAPLDGRTTGVHQYYDGVADELPNIELNDNVQKIYDSMSFEQRLGQTIQYAIGDLTGPPIIDGSDDAWLTLIEQGMVGSMLNVLNLTFLNMAQKAAKEATGVPLLMGYDILHGFKTIFPVNLGMASSWDPDMVEEATAIAAGEAAAGGLYWAFAPMVDLTRDPRWGRMSEGFGEDPLLTGRLGAAVVRGYQNNGVVSCVKHVAAYGAGEGSVEYQEADMSWYKLHNEYLLPYKAAVEAGAYTTMSSFNLLNGVPMHAYREVHEDIMRGMFGFRGFTVSDYGAIMELSHHNVSDVEHPENAAIQGLYAGVDMDMADGFYDKLRTHKDDVLPNGSRLEDVVNLSCKRVLKVKQDIGLFEHGGVAQTEDRDELWNTVWFTDEHLEVSRQAAIKSSVLLVNKDKTLPMTAPGEDDTREFLLIGRMADFPDDLMGSWSGLYMDPEMTPRQHTITREVDKRFGCKLADSEETVTDTGCNWQYRKGWNQIYDGTPNDGKVDDGDIAANKEVLDLIKADPKRFSVIFMVVGESFVQNGESTARANLELPLTQAQLVKDVRAAADPLAKLVLILNIGRPNIITWEAENADAILLTWAPGSMAGPAVFDMVFGEAAPSGRLPVSFPRSVGQIPVYHSKRPSGRMMPEGMEDGVYNPLTDKFFSRYLDEKVTPLFPFGYGLSYNEFEIADVSIDQTTIKSTANFTVSATVKRSGSHLDLPEGEVVQVYVHQATGTFSPSVKKLKEFQRVEFANGDGSKTVQITMNATDAFGYYDGQLNFIVEEGKYYIFVVHDSSQAGKIEDGIVIEVKN